MLAANDCYALDPDSELEQGIAAWVKNGGMLLHGPMDLLAQASVGSRCLSHEKDAFECSGEKGMLTGTQFGSFEEENADVLAVWETDEKPCQLSSAHLGREQFAKSDFSTALNTPAESHRTFR